MWHLWLSSSTFFRACQPQLVGTGCFLKKNLFKVLTKVLGMVGYFCFVICWIKVRICTNVKGCWAMVWHYYLNYFRFELLCRAVLKKLGAKNTQLYFLIFCENLMDFWHEQIRITNICFFKLALTVKVKTSSEPINTYYSPIFYIIICKSENTKKGWPIFLSLTRVWRVY